MQVLTLNPKIAIPSDISFFVKTKSVISEQLENLIFKIKDLAENSIFFQAAIGLSVGIICNLLLPRITMKFLSAIGAEKIIALLENNPFFKMSLVEKILMFPIVCISAPIGEEIVFRGGIQPLMEYGIAGCLNNCGLRDSIAKKVATVASIIFTSMIFGASHFINALVFWCNPLVFVPQVIFTTIFGAALGILSKMGEPCSFTSVFVPTCAHFSNNAIAWTACLFIK